MIRIALAVAATVAVLFASPVAAPTDAAAATRPARSGPVQVIGHPETGEFTVVTGAGRRVRVPAAGDSIARRCVPMRDRRARVVCARRYAGLAEALARRTPYDPAHWLADVSPAVAVELGIPRRGSVEVYGDTTVVISGDGRLITS